VEFAFPFTENDSGSIGIASISLAVDWLLASATD
jgi:hypothetical protein